jgi:hypothetical protein
MQLNGGKLQQRCLQQVQGGADQEGREVQPQGAPRHRLHHRGSHQLDRRQEDQRTGPPAHPQLQHPPQRHQRCVQAQEVPGEHRRRTARRHREAGQGLPGRQAQADRGRQDGRPPRQQGYRGQDRSRCRHAVHGGRYSGGHRAEPAGRAFPHEPGQIYETVLGWAGKKLGRKYATPIFDGATHDQINAETDEAGVSRASARPTSTTAARAIASTSRPPWA